MFRNGNYYRALDGVDTVCDICEANDSYQKLCEDNYGAEESYYEFWERMVDDVNNCVCCGVECHDLSIPRPLFR